MSRRQVGSGRLVRLLLCRFLDLQFGGGFVNLALELISGALELTEALAVPMVNVSHHLRVLRHAGIVSGRKQGRFVHYTLRQSMIATPVGKDGRQVLDLGCCQLQLPRRGLVSLSKPT